MVQTNQLRGYQPKLGVAGIEVLNIDEIGPRGFGHRPDIPKIWRQFPSMLQWLWGLRVRDAKT